MPNVFRPALVSTLLACLTGCSVAPQQPTPPTTGPQEIPAQIYLEAVAKSDVFQVVPERSRAEILVRRDGRLQRLGHDHVISAARIEGFALLDAERIEDSRADLVIDLTALAVDTPELRTVYQLDTHPSESDVQGTATNMSEHVLQTGTWPRALVQVMQLESVEGEARCMVSLTLKGKTRTFPATVIVHRTDDILRVRGSFDLNQSDFGIEPFSVLGGALTIQDRVEVTYRLEGARLH